MIVTIAFYHFNFLLFLFHKIKVWAALVHLVTSIDMRFGRNNGQKSEFTTQKGVSFCIDHEAKVGAVDARWRPWSLCGFRCRHFPFYHFGKPPDCQPVDLRIQRYCMNRPT